jgi:hypothetical protein
MVYNFLNYVESQTLAFVYTFAIICRLSKRLLDD